MQQLNALFKEVSIVLFKDEFILLSVCLETESFENTKGSVNLSDSLLKSLVAQVDHLELWFAWVLHHITSVDRDGFQASLANTRLSILGIECFHSFDSVLYFLEWRPLFLLLNVLKCLGLIEGNAFSFALVSLELDLHCKLCIKEGFLLLFPIKDCLFSLLFIIKPLSCAHHLLIHYSILFHFEIIDFLICLSSLSGGFDFFFSDFDTFFFR